MTVHGFNERQIAEALKRFVLAGGVDSTSSSQEEHGKRSPNRKLWLFTPKTAITAAPGGEAGVDYEVGSGEAYVLELNRETKVLEKLTDSDGDWVYKTVYNHHESSIPDEAGTVFFGQQDWRGNYWVADIEETGETGTGTGTDCISEIQGVDLYDLPTETTSTAAPYALGINSDGCLCKIPTKACPEEEA